MASKRESYKMARAAKKAQRMSSLEARARAAEKSQRMRSQKEQIARENRIYKREMDIIMAWLKANDLDYEMQLYTKTEYEKKEGRGAAHGASLILQGEAGAPCTARGCRGSHRRNALITVLNTTEPLDYYEELNDAFLALLQGRELGFGRDAGYELLNHYTIGIYEVL